MEVRGKPARHLAVRVVSLFGVAIEALTQKPGQGGGGFSGPSTDGGGLDPVIDRKGKKSAGIGLEQFVCGCRPAFRDLLGESGGGRERDAGKGVLLRETPKVFSQLILQESPK
jgi:hypothetical protein